jgi:dTDP-4-amino-4,6-dideoxygalactose transaminase
MVLAVYYIAFVLYLHNVQRDLRGDDFRLSCLLSEYLLKLLMHVPFVDFRASHHKIKEDILQRIGGVIEKGDFILGGEVEIFEQQYAEYSGTKYCVGVSNGLDALKIALRTLGIGKGDEVIVPAHTYIASIFAVIEAGAVPILVEPDLKTYNITAATIAPAITGRTKAIMPVHLYGQPCDMAGIMVLAKKHSLYVVEDNAQAQGASHKGKKTGSFGHINATSFYPSKNLGAMGDAGAITTLDERLAHTAHMYRNMGSDTKYYHTLTGYNARLDTIQAAVLNYKLPYLAEWNRERQGIAKRYTDNLNGCSVFLPETIDGAEHVYHLYVIRDSKRQKLQQYLQQHNIQTLIHYPVPAHLQPALSGLGHAPGDFPITEEISHTCLSLPLFPGLSESQIDFVSEKVIAFDKEFS